MTDSDEIVDRTLANEEKIEPSPWFAARVMSAIRRETRLAPLAFPAGRFGAAVTLLLVLLAFGAAPDGSALTFSASGGAMLIVFLAAAGLYAVIMISAGRIRRRRSRGRGDATGS